MAKRWQASRAFTDVHYYGKVSTGYLEKAIDGEWMWRWFGDDGYFKFGRDLKMAKKCAAALVELEG